MIEEHNISTFLSNDRNYFQFLLPLGFLLIFVSSLVKRMPNFRSIVPSIITHCAMYILIPSKMKASLFLRRNHRRPHCNTVLKSSQNIKIRADFTFFSACESLYVQSTSRDFSDIVIAHNLSGHQRQQQQSASTVDAEPSAHDRQDTTSPAPCSPP